MGTLEIVGLVLVAAVLVLAWVVGGQDEDDSDILAKCTVRMGR